MKPYEPMTKEWADKCIAEWEADLGPLETRMKDTMARYEAELLDEDLTRAILRERDQLHERISFVEDKICKLRRLRHELPTAASLV